MRLVMGMDWMGMCILLGVQTTPSLNPGSWLPAVTLGC